MRGGGRGARCGGKGRWEGHTRGRDGWDPHLGEASETIDVELTLKARQFGVREKLRKHSVAEKRLVVHAERHAVREPACDLGRRLLQQIIKLDAVRTRVETGRQNCD